MCEIRGTELHDIVYFLYISSADRSSQSPITISTPGYSLIQVLMTTRSGGMQTQTERRSSSRSAAAVAAVTNRPTERISTSTAARLQSNPVDKYDANGKAQTSLLQ